ncbi:toll-like receptor 8 isoform X2 [Sitophilus oryzae]|uniref:Toll-like receptor 8 isoform X2 n=1 Tax=Sitophilus oryzae TaxID=7048 RepID=A0A6J2YFW4_SITOR|nr:toll-like receptor 8 isoform X2 [Sitophilus oryzae]
MRVSGFILFIIVAVLVGLSSGLKYDNFTEFVAMVESNITASESYVIPKDNSDLLNTTNSTVYAMQNQECFLPQGKVIGGGTTINAALYVRGHPEDFDRWESVYGNPGWSYADVLPYFKKTENAAFEHVDLTYGGVDGYYTVNHSSRTAGLDELLSPSFESSGLKYLWDYNGAEEVGYSPFQFSTKGNERTSTASAFLHGFTSRRNLNLSINSFVTKVAIDNATKTAEGVYFVKDGVNFYARATKEVIVSAGAINSAQLLIISGIGPKNHLEELDIPIIQNLPVGQYLQDHVMFIGLTIRTNKVLNNQTLVEMLALYEQNLRPLTSGFNTEVIAFTNFGQSQNVRPDIEYLLATPSPSSTDAQFIFRIMKTLYSFLSLLWLCPLIRMNCITEPGWNDKSQSIKCKNTSLQYYTYDIQQLTHFIFYYSFGTRLSIEVVYSNFSNINYLPNYFKDISNTRVVRLRIRYCGVRTVSYNALNEFIVLEELDLSFNQLETLAIDYSGLSHLRVLNISHNQFFTIDIGSFNRIIYLDLGYNKIEEVNKTSYLGSRSTLNLQYNSIKNVSCNDGPNGQLTELNLSGNIINSTLFGNILKCFPTRKLSLTNSSLKLDHDFELPYTETIDLSNNSISYFSFKFERSLESLNLSYNSLSTFKSSHTRITIKKLDLSHNRIKNVEDLDKTGKYHDLNLSYNNITEVKPNIFSRFKDMDLLNLSFNKLLIKLSNYSFVNEMQQTVPLKILNLKNCSLMLIEVHSFVGLKYLSELNLENNMLESIIPGTFDSLEKVKKINLKGNIISILKNRTFHNLRYLENIDISNNRIKLIQSEFVYNLENLLKIEITKNKIESMVIEDRALCNVPRLEELILIESKISNISWNLIAESLNKNNYEERSKTIDISKNPITTITYDGLLKYPNYKATYLKMSIASNLNESSFQSMSYLNEVLITDSHIPTIRNASFLGLFDLLTLEIKNSTIENIETNALIGLFNLNNFQAKDIFRKIKVIPGFIFKDMFSLTDLDLSDIGLVEVMSRAFYGLKTLMKLHLNLNNLKHINNDTFVDMQSLELLDLSDNNLIKLDDKNFEGLINLKELRLNTNSINTISIKAFEGLNSLEILRIEDNEIQNIALGVFQNFPQLKTLNLNGNLLVEFQVGAFSNLPLLENLYMENNNVSAILTESLLPLRSLVTLDLEWNHIKKIDYDILVSNFNKLKTVGIAKNKFPCDYLKGMIAKFNKFQINYATKNPDYHSDNIDGIDCIDVCKYLLCLKDSHGIN